MPLKVQRKSPDTNLSGRTCKQLSLRLRLLKIEFAFRVLVDAEHTSANKQHIRQS